MTEHPRNPAGEEESYHQGTASMSTDAALEDDAFTPSPPDTERTVTEPARRTPVHAETEVLVVGGGPAGCAAALAAGAVGLDRPRARRVLARAPRCVPRHEA
jgi:NADPH-dependent 2,4-dienoyl-CoA reductase/sulfur reductase-like enzyme